jgi:tetratricopeptide (TPR) repeat protein
MRYPAKLLSLATLAVLLATSDVTASQRPTQRLDFSEASGSLLAQTDPTGNVLLEVDGVLKEGDEQLNDGSLYDVYPFEGQAGQSITIRLESQDFDTYLLLIDSEGQELARNDDHAGSTNSRLAVTLPYDDNYQILTNAFSRLGRGAYHLTITETTADEAVQIEALLEVEGTLEDTDETLSDGSLYDIYIFEGQAGQAVNISLQSQEFDTYLLLLDSQDREIGRNDDSAGSTNSQLTLTIPADDIYQIVANAYDARGHGRYRLIVNEAIEDEVRQAEAYRTLQQAEGLLSRQGNLNSRQAEANILLQQGREQYDNNRLPAALHTWEQALAIYREIGDRSGEGNALGSLGVGYETLEEYGQAINYYQQYLEIARELGNLTEVGNALGNLGIVHRN